VDGWQVWLLGAAALHLGFQATVTLLVYPALLERGARGDGWAAAHEAHSRRITPLVVVVYGALLPPLVVAGWTLARGGAGWGTALCITGAVVAFVATAAVAAPAHSRLARGWAGEVGVRLARADAVRLAGAVLCLAGAAVP
jgi:hypothetical protein